MVQDHLRNLSSLRATCKQWSVGLAVAVLLAGAWGRLVPANLLWAAAPLVFLALADAAYAAQERRCAEFLAELSASNEAKLVLLPETPGRSVGRVAAAVLLLSVWPFYLGLAGVVLAGSRALPAPVGEIAADANVPLRPIPPNPQVAAPPTANPGQMPPFTPRQGPQFQGQPPQTPSRPMGLNLPHLPPMHATIVRTGSQNSPPSATPATPPFSRTVTPPPVPGAK